MSDQDESYKAHSTTPLVGRPRGAAWRALQADGVVWEGQIFIVGDQLDLAARMIVTHRRVAFARGGEVVLDVARPWLRPAPYLRRDGTVVLSIATPGARYGDPPETVALRMRDGQPTAGHLVAMLAGTGARRVPPDLDALEAVVRPALPERTEDRLPAPPTWPDAPLAVGGASLVSRELSPASFSASVPPAPLELEPASPDLEPIIRQPAPPVASGRDRDWNLPLRGHLVPRGQRRSRWGWALRLTGLVALLATAAALGAGRIPSPLDGLEGDAGQPTVPTSSDRPTPTSVPLLAQDPAEQTAIALGVGGPNGEVEPTAPSAVIADDPASAIDRDSLAAPAAPTSTAPPPAVIAPIDTEPADDERADPPAVQAETEVPEEPVAEPSATPEPTPGPEPTATAQPAPPATQLPPTTAPAVRAATPGGDREIASPVAAATASAASEFAVAPRLAVGGQTLPAYGLPPSPDGNWVVVVVDVANPGPRPITIPLEEFRLRAADGAESPLDPGADLVASIVGLDPAGAPEDAIELGPDEARRLLLLFQIDPAASGLTLLAGEEEVALSGALATGGDLADLPEEPSAP